MQTRMMRVFILCALFGLFSVNETCAQVPTLRDEVRKHGYAWRTGISDELFLEDLVQVVDRSDVIIRGRVVNEGTRLSRDEMNVLTDYTIEILEIYKDSASNARVGARLIVTRIGGNLLLEGKPVRQESAGIAPIPWIAPHVFFIVRAPSPEADGEYFFASTVAAAYRLEQQKVVCDGQSQRRHSVSGALCGKSENDLLGAIKLGTQGGKKSSKQAKQ
jgi:hypothetical protein